MNKGQSFASPTGNISLFSEDDTSAHIFLGPVNDSEKQQMARFERRLDQAAKASGTSAQQSSSPSRRPSPDRGIFLTANQRMNRSPEASPVPRLPAIRRATAHASPISPRLLSLRPRKRSTMSPIKTNPPGSARRKKRTSLPLKVSAADANPLAAVAALISNVNTSPEPVPVVRLENSPLPPNPFVAPLSSPPTDRDEAGANDVSSEDSGSDIGMRQRKSPKLAASSSPRTRSNSTHASDKSTSKEPDSSSHRGNAVDSSPSRSPGVGEKDISDVSLFPTKDREHVPLLTSVTGRFVGTVSGEDDTANSTSSLREIGALPSVKSSLELPADERDEHGSRVRSLEPTSSQGDKLLSPPRGTASQEAQSTNGAIVSSPSKDRSPNTSKSRLGATSPTLSKSQKRQSPVRSQSGPFFNSASPRKAAAAIELVPRTPTRKQDPLLKFNPFLTTTPRTVSPSRRPPPLPSVQRSVNKFHVDSARKAAMTGYTTSSAFPASGQKRRREDNEDDRAEADSSRPVKKLAVSPLSSPEHPDYVKMFEEFEKNYQAEQNRPADATDSPVGKKLTPPLSTRVRDNGLLYTSEPSRLNQSRAMVASRSTDTALSPSKALGTPAARKVIYKPSPARMRALKAQGSPSKQASGRNALNYAQSPKGSAFLHLSPVGRQLSPQRRPPVRDENTKGQGMIADQPPLARSVLSQSSAAASLAPGERSSSPRFGAIIRKGPPVAARPSAIPIPAPVKRQISRLPRPSTKRTVHRPAPTSLKGKVFAPLDINVSMTHTPRMTTSGSPSKAESLSGNKAADARQTHQVQGLDPSNILSSDLAPPPALSTRSRSPTPQYHGSSSPPPSDSSADPLALVSDPPNRRNLRRSSTATSTYQASGTAAQQTKKSASKQKSAEPLSVNDMSATALRNLTVRNTAHNNGHLCTVDLQVVLKEGVRPPSPGPKPRSASTTPEGQAEAARQTRARRRNLIRGETPATGTDGGGDLKRDHPQVPAKHPRAPGDEEDYSTPKRVRTAMDGNMPDEPQIPRPDFGGERKKSSSASSSSSSKGSGTSETFRNKKYVRWNKLLAMDASSSGADDANNGSRKVKSSFTKPPMQYGLDVLGNPANAKDPMSLQKDHIVVTKIVYEDDSDDEPIVKKARKEAGRQKAAATSTNAD